MTDHIKGLLALAFRAPEDSETFAALLSKLDNEAGGPDDIMQPENPDTRHRDEADPAAGVRDT
jgi:hypothetical protein